MIRCVRIWTDDTGNSVFEAGHIELSDGERGDALSVKTEARWVSFRETQPGGSFEWHDAPTRQLVITLSGRLEFETKDGACFTIDPGDVLLAEDTTGTGHSWKLNEREPWRRAYVILSPDADARFVPSAET